MKAIALVSGGLDSTLAVKLIKDQGIELVGLNFKTPFCLCDGKAGKGCVSHALQATQNLGIEFKAMSISEDFLEVLKAPKHGFGSNMNPCIDCRILKFKKAKEFMLSSGASFIITGEVVGQRPMSQLKHTLKLIDKESDMEGLVLRPLSAQLLPATIPEEKGWVKREKLLKFSGRGRRPQMDLAAEFNIKDYPCPAGGCLLTYSGFAKKIKDLLKYGILNLEEVALLKMGRHFRLTSEAKLIVGKDEQENERLAGLARPEDCLFIPSEVNGPGGLGRGKFDPDLIRLSSSIISFYCDRDGAGSAEIIFKNNDRQGSMSVEAIKEKDLELLRI